MEMSKKCPFNREECNEECALFIAPEELNETVRNKLASIGLIGRQIGICSFKHSALCMGRQIFENTSGFLK